MAFMRLLRRREAGKKVYMLIIGALIKDVTNEIQSAGNKGKLLKKKLLMKPKR